MKKVILSMAAIAAIGLTNCKNETKKETDSFEKTEEVKEVALSEASFGVRGNCSMCKNTIEKAANSVEGVNNANWDVNKKKIEVSFDKNKTSLMAIHEAIAASGYDTEKLSGNEEAYKNLPACCQYDHSMEMNQSGETEPGENHSGHNH
ncbi:heavy-metal-associated domain-containing protein [Abyssalbus ytuae]|uniref:Cation transporter n=1 Tax=Abyssalbus ytuae TaxID=2926907 RepID=A0A9E7CTN2_9FLAO|nr:heavy-metal-associated domain-containing protein [Abyssalbus ytuae]UOB16482.1 cation transporter [Abyssalbus ytuae]